VGEGVFGYQTRCKTLRGIDDFVICDYKIFGCQSAQLRVGGGVMDKTFELRQRLCACQKTVLLLSVSLRTSFALSHSFRA